MNGQRYAIYLAGDRTVLAVPGWRVDLDAVARCEWEALDDDRASFRVVDHAGREHRVHYALPIDALERADRGFEPPRDDLLSAIWRYWKSERPRRTQWLAP